MSISRTFWALAAGLVPLLVVAPVLAAPQAVVESAPSSSPAARPAISDATDHDVPPPAVYGLFPIWEQTGAVEESGAARVGMRHGQVGIGRLTFGTDPYLDLYGTLNANAKLGLVREGRLRLALQAAWYLVPAASESRGIGNLHATGFANPYAAITLVPVAAGATLLATPHLHLHLSATALKTLSVEPDAQTLTGGVASWVEWWASSHRSVRVHVGIEGFPTETQEHVGISFAWRARYVALQAGYARSFAPEGTSANTFMFDGALLFP